MTAKLEERMRRMKEGSVMTPIGSVRLGDRLEIRWLEGDGQFYTGTVKALSDAGVTVRQDRSLPNVFSRRPAC